MTLETCKKRLALAKTDEEKKFWEERIARRVMHRSGKYRHLVEKAKEVKQDGKKPKG